MHRSHVTAVPWNDAIRSLRLIILPLLIAILLPCAASAATQENAIQARSAILMDLNSGEILYEQNADQPIPPASLTKVMSMFVIFDAVKKGKVRLGDQVTVSQAAARTGGSRMHLKKREQLSLDMILTGMAVSSGNDASTAAAEHVAGDVKSFVAAMNAKAAAIGMKNTVFVNPTGLPAAGHITTARDMLTMARAYLRAYPDALEYHSQKTLVHNRVQTRNHNPLLESCPGADGLKSGWVCASGYNLITTAKRDGTRLVGVILGAATPGMRARENLRLMEAGFASLRGQTTVAEILPATPVPEYRRARRGKAKAQLAEVRPQVKEDKSSKRGKRTQTASPAKENESPKSAKASAKVAKVAKDEKRRVSVEYASAKMRVTRTAAADDVDQPASKKSPKRSKKSKVQSAKAKSEQTTGSTPRKRSVASKKAKSEPKTEARAKTRSGDS